MCMDGGDNIGHNTNQATPYLGDARTFQILHKYPELIKNYQVFKEKCPQTGFRAVCLGILKRETRACHLQSHLEDL